MQNSRETVSVTPPLNETHRLAKLLAPRSIALVGASERSPWTANVRDNLDGYGFDGKLFAVNPRGVPVFGIPGFTSCAAIGEPVDVAFLLVPQQALAQALEDVAAGGIRNAAILTAGFAEMGEEGARAQDELFGLADQLGITVWGPNSLGFNNVSARTPISSIPAMLPILPPSIGIVTQSGAVAFEIYELANSQNIGASFVAATGNEARINIADVIDYLLDDPDTHAIAVFTEAVRNPKLLIAAAERARASRKPIVMLKVGRSQLSSEIAQAHTGSLVGSDEVFDAICRRHGIIRVDTPEELVVTAGLLAAVGPLEAPGVRFVSMSGGSCTLVADCGDAVGVRLPAFSPETASSLRKVLPDIASTINPLDVTAGVLGDLTMYDRILPLAAQDDGVGLLAVGITLPTSEDQRGSLSTLEAIGRSLNTIARPAICIGTCAKTVNDFSRELLTRFGLPHLINGIGAALPAISRAVWWSEQLKQAPRAWPEQVRSDRKPRDEKSTLDLLASAGVPVVPMRVVQDAAGAASAAAEFGGNVVLKVLSPDIAHKTEAGGVRLDVAPSDAAAAYDALRAAVAERAPDAGVKGVLIAPMRRGGIELIVSTLRDPSWGPMLMVGLGGTLVELIGDTQLAPLPVTPDDVKAMLGRLKGSALLSGFRGRQAADLDVLAASIVAIGEAAIHLGSDLVSLEVNPLLVDGSRIEALDALTIWSGEEPYAADREHR